MRAGEPRTLSETKDLLDAALARSGADARGFAELADGLRDAMQRHCLVEKTAEGLEAALALAREVKRETAAPALSAETLVSGLSTRNMAQACELVLLACLNRRETRSAHYRLDCHRRDDANWARSVTVRRDGDGIAFGDLRYAAG